MKKKLCFIAIVSILLLIVILTACGSDTANNVYPLSAHADKLFAAWDKPDSPGAAAAVLKDHNIIFKKGYGSAQLEYEIPITPATTFHVASVSKQFTAFSIVKLAQEGKLSLDDDIRKYLHEVPDFGKTITIRHLVHHTSGLRDQWELLAIAGWRLDDVITKEHILNLVKHQKELNFDPGDKYLYCNTGYTLLAEIVKRVSGQSFPEWTKENIFIPLGMNHTHFHDDHERIVKNRAYSYAPVEGGRFKKRILSYANVGATSLFTTAEDLLKWADNFFTKRLGGPEAITLMEQQGVLNNGEKISYAFGVGVGEYKGLKIISHSGGDAGFRSHLLLFPEQKTAIVVLSNHGGLNPSRLARQIADIFLKDFLKKETSGKTPGEKKPVKIPTAVYEAYEGQYEMEDGNIMIITKEGEKLMAEYTAAPAKMQLFPESMARFFLKIADVQIQFFPERDGFVERMTLFMEGTSIKGKRRPLQKLSKEQLSVYTGEYYCPELDTTYRIFLDNGSLIARHFRHGDISLILLKKDIFTGRRWFFKNLNFKRNSGDRITGFRLTGGRVRNLLFEKQ
jgi:CubicO group peptidase (beta-lactamase class C family)